MNFSGWRRWGLFAICALLFSAIVTRQYLEERLDQSLNIPVQGAFLRVLPGDSLAAVLQRADAAGWLTSSTAVLLWARWYGLDRGLHVGEYALTGSMSPRDLVQLLNAGTVVQHSVTLPEGLTLVQALARLQAHPAITAVLEGPRDPRLLALVAPRTSAEGLFLPETYRFTRGDTDLAILTRAYRLMEDVLTTTWPGRAEDLSVDSPYEALILASLVERETSAPEERARIAGVFNRRLKQGMRLQTDPSVIYGLGLAYDGNLTREHLRDPDNLWNTYRRDGLPPTPIALPGRAAIYAALHPQEGTELYFVAQGDGYHAFATTLEEHNANVRRYQYRRRRDYRSTPALSDKES